MTSPQRLNTQLHSSNVPEEMLFHLHDLSRAGCDYLGFYVYPSNNPSRPFLSIHAEIDRDLFPYGYDHRGSFDLCAKL